MGFMDLFRAAPRAESKAHPVGINGMVKRERAEARVARLKAKLARQLARGAPDDAIDETRRSIRHYEAVIVLTETGL